MSNEVLLLLSVLIIYGSTLIFLKVFGKQGLYCFTSIATIAANIEVLIVVIAFGMEMTLGNVLFASTFLVTDIISEIYGKKEAKTAVHIGIATSILFIVVVTLHTCKIRFCNACNENNILKYTKINDCQHACIRNCTGI